jgi:Family of unknown function (DUF5419)
MLDFDAWMKEIDKLLVSEIGVGHDDLPDQNYYDCYDDGMTPQEVVDEVILEELRGEGLWE